MLAPHINGNVALTSGEVSGPQLPTNFENLQLTANINGETTQQLNGGWTSGKQGQGSISSDVAWGKATAVNVWSRAIIFRSRLSHTPS